MSLISEKEQNTFHLSLGRRLWGKLKPDELDQKLFLVTNQLCLGSDAIPDEDGREAVAELCLKAGTRASKSSAFGIASTYLASGIDLLGARHWRDQYELSLDLFCFAAEVATSQGDYPRADSLLEEASSHARIYLHKIRANSVQVYSLGCRNDHRGAIDVGLKALAGLGHTFPKKGRKATIVYELIKTKRLIRGMSDENILAIPPMQDEQMLATMRLLMFTYSYALFGRPEMAPLYIMRSIQLTMKYGLASITCPSFTYWGVVLCAAEISNRGFDSTSLPSSFSRDSMRKNG